MERTAFRIRFIVVSWTSSHSTSAPAAPDAAEPVAAAPPAFFKRMPAHLGSDLLALGAEDHYLRVTTGAGSDLILMRLSDALAELGDGLGLQVHRSWWVACAAIDTVSRDKGRTTLLLKNGLEVPVSRTYLSACGRRWPPADALPV